MKTALFTLKTILLSFFVWVFAPLQAQTTHEIMWSMSTTPEQATITIEVGDTIKWIWAEDGMPHDVSSTDPNAPEDFGSPIVSDLGYEYEYTFNEEVTFEYKCIVHPTTMVGVITVVATASVNDVVANKLAVYPNPTKDILTIESLSALRTYRIFDIQGKQITEKVLGNNDSTINVDVSSFENGIYFIEVLSDNQQLSTFKIIKN